MNKENTPTECPVCGSEKLEQQKKETTVCVPYGTEKKLSETTYRCAECKTTFNDDSSLDVAIKTALESAKKDSVKKILSYFSENRMNFAGMERALDLPQRTISRWKTEGAVDAPALALLRMIRTFPWLIDVADNKYDEIISKRIHIMKAIETFYSEFKVEDKILSASLDFRKKETELCVSASVAYDGRDGMDKPITDNNPVVITTNPTDINTEAKAAA